MYKFRALKDDISNCNFVYGNLIYQNGTPRIQYKDTEMFRTCFSGTEGMYTGFSDSDGVKIYVGDILKCEVGVNEIIEFKNGGSWCRYRHISLYELILQPGQGFFKVIGNVHEHANLLDNQKIFR